MTRLDNWKHDHEKVAAWKARDNQRASSVTRYVKPPWPGDIDFIATDCEAHAPMSVEEVVLHQSMDAACSE